MFKFNKRNLIVSSIVLATALLFAAFTANLRNPANSLIKYPLITINAIRREALGLFFFHRNYILNDKLRVEVNRLKSQLSARSEIVEENKRFANLLGFKQKSPFSVVASRVIGRSPDNWSSIIIIDKGGYHGLKRGFAAVNESGLLGRVAEVSRTSSRVMLINDPSLSISCIDTRSRQEGLVSGALGNSLIMKYLPRDADIKVSDVIVTSGLTDAFPKGFLVGKVIEVGEEFSGLSRFAIIKPAVNLSSVEEALVIIP